MKQFVLHALLEAFVIPVDFDLVCLIYGAVSGSPYKVISAGGVIRFLVLFFVELIECLWRSRGEQQVL